MTRLNNNGKLNTILKLIILTTLIMSIHSIRANGQVASRELRQADSLVQKQEYRKAYDIFRMALHNDTKDRKLFYNAACAAAKVGEKSTAMKWLNRAVDLGWKDYKSFENDEDLKGLHEVVGWQKLLDRTKKLETAYQSKYGSLEKEIDALLTSDQAIRKEYLKYFRAIPKPTAKVDSLGKEMRKIDSLNAVKISLLIDPISPKDISILSDKAVRGIFAIVQHGEVEMQEKYEFLIKSAAANGQINPALYCMFEDRILINKGNDQVYGTQIATTKAGYSYIYPVTEPKELENRRKSMGMPPMNNYLRSLGFNLTWDPEEHISQKEKLKALQLESLKK